jgi:cell division protein FtsX
VIYSKSLAAGLAAVLLAAMLLPFVMAVYFRIVYKPFGNEVAGWDPVSFARWPVAWLVITLIFLIGFVWEFRRAKAK